MRIGTARISLFDGFMRRVMVASGVFVLGAALSVLASTNETSSFSPVFVKDGTGRLRTLTWTYQVNGGQPIIVEDADTGEMTMKCGDLKLTVNPLAKTREGSFAVSISGAARGSATAKFTESLEDLVDKVSVKSQQVGIGMNMSAEGVSVSILVNLLTQYSPSAEWFLDRSDLDQLDIGFEWNDEVQGDTTGSVKVTIPGYGSDSQDVFYSGIVPDTWTIVDRLDRYQVGERIYRNVVVVERITQVATGDMDGTIEEAMLTYWVAQGVGMIKGVGQYQFMGNPLEIELKSSTLKIPALLLTQAISFPAIPAKAIGEVFDPGAKAPTKLPVTYESSDESVAIVRDDGLIETVGAGTATITAFENEGDDFYKVAKPVSKILTVKARVSVAVDPLAGGTVTGTGLYALGQKVTLTAKPATGYTFLHWENASQAPVRAVVTPAGNMTVAAYFGVTTNITLPVTENPGAQDAMVGVAFTKSLPIVSECLPKVVLVGLPPGLKYDANTVSVAGVPTKPGTFAVTFTASNVKGAAAPQTFSITVAPLPVWAWGAFNGYVDIMSGDADLGTETYTDGIASMSVTSQGQITGKFTCGGTNYAFNAGSYVTREDGFGVLGFATEAKAGKTVIPLRFDVWSSSASGPEGNAPYSLGASWGGYLSEEEGFYAFMYRNVWKDPGIVPAVTNFTGYYTATLPAGDEGYGSGYLTFTVDKAGGVKTAGKLADGTAVSLGGTLILDEGGLVVLPLYVAPAVYKGGCLFGFAEFNKASEGSAVTLRLLDDAPIMWGSGNPMATGEYGAGFLRELGLSGGWYDKLVNLREYYESGLTVGGIVAPSQLLATVKYTELLEDWDGSLFRDTWTEETFVDPASVSPNSLRLGVTPVTGIGTGLSAPKAGVPVKVTDPDTGEYLGYNYNELENPTGLMIAFTRATGLFKGTFNVYYDYVSAEDNTTGKQTWSHVIKKASYEGALTPVREQGEAEGRGFFLWADKGWYETGKVDSYGETVWTSFVFNGSYDFLLSLP